MHRVIDTIHFSSAMLQRYPEMQMRGEGILAILDPKDTVHGFREDAKRATVTVSSGHKKSLAIDAVEKNKAGVIGLFFRGATDQDVHRDAVIAVS